MFLIELQQGWYTGIADGLNFLGNMCVVAITIYTFYLTFMSKKVKLLGCGQEDSMFYGTKLSFTVHNYSMQAFDIKSVYFICGKDCMVPFELTEPLMLEPRKSLQINLPEYTSLSETIDRISEDYKKHWCLVLKTQSDVICASPRKWDSGWRVIRAIKKQKFRRIGIIRQCVGDVVVSEQVAYNIIFYHDDMVENVLMTSYGYTQQCIMGCSDFSKYVGHPKKLRKYIANITGLPSKCIIVEKLFPIGLEENDNPMDIQLIDETTGENLLEGAIVNSLNIRK